MSRNLQSQPGRTTDVPAPLNQQAISAAVARGRALHSLYIANAFGGALRWLFRAPALLCAAVGRIAEKQRQRRELEEIDERTLKDLGMTREGFKAVAYGTQSPTPAANDRANGAASAA
ncbi:MAG: DUF1127 domain-containing protein [Alphaproteobacteria bacterium]|nr:DUF1127 domain-containing protein [Alphaproteobacteria bacterium]